MHATTARRWATLSPCLLTAQIGCPGTDRLQSSVLKMAVGSSTPPTSFLTWEGWGMGLLAPSCWAVQCQHSIPDHVGRALQSNYSAEGENPAMSISASLPPTRLFLSSQLVSKIFYSSPFSSSSTKSLDLKPKNSGNSLQSALMGTTVTMLIMFSSHSAACLW